MDGICVQGLCLALPVLQDTSIRLVTTGLPVLLPMLLLLLLLLLLMLPLQLLPLLSLIFLLLLMLRFKFGITVQFSHSGLRLLLLLLLCHIYRRFLSLSHSLALWLARALLMPTRYIVH